MVWRPAAAGRDRACGRRKLDPVQSKHTLVHTPRTARREDLVERDALRGARGGGRIAPARGERPGPAAAPGEAGALALGRYRLLERLGAGGFGVVWHARDELLGREVALKRITLPPDGDSERASREALASARLAHPAIVALYEACAAPDAFYLISELVRGETLAQLIAADALDDERVLHIGIALAGALAHAHARGVIHRDVKPQNVLVPRTPEADSGASGALAVAKLTDFGGASLAGDDALTRTGDVLGTLAYMAPEQSDGGDVGEAADLYSLALILYEALSGVNPVRGATPAATVRRIGRPIAPLEHARRDLPSPLARALDRALAPGARDRGTLEQLRDGLERSLEQAGPGGPGAARAASPPLAAAGSLRPRWSAGPAPAAPQRMPRQRPAFADEVPSWATIRTQRAARSRAPLRSSAGPIMPALRSRALRSPAPPQEPLVAETPQVGRRRARGLARALGIACAAAALLWEIWVGRPGLALLLLAALAPLAALTSERLRGVHARHGTIAGAWLVAGALAPALGLARLAGAFPALAGQATNWRTRAALGALGYWWLTLSEPLLARGLWLGPRAGTPPRAAWEASLGSAVTHVLGPMLSPGVLLGAALWGAGAMCLPWLVRGRRAALDVVAVTTWSAAMAAAAPLVDRGLSAGAHASPRGAVLGAVFGGVFAVAARALRGPV
jgi:serine/threonine protein kinase